MKRTYKTDKWGRYYEVSFDDIETFEKFYKIMKNEYGRVGEQQVDKELGIIIATYDFNKSGLSRVKDFRFLFDRDYMDVKKRIK